MNLQQLRYVHEVARRGLNVSDAAEVLFTGAQGLIPERASPYSVQLQWALDGSDWKLRDLRWQ